MELDELRANRGQEVAVSEWCEITQDRIDAFARVTEDAQWIHVDPDRASRESPYASPIAHGFLTLALLSFLSREAVEIRGDFRMRINYGLNRVRFPAAVKSGSRVRARFVPQAVRDVPGSVEIVWGVTVEIEAQTKPACVAEWVTRLYYEENSE